MFMPSQLHFKVHWNTAAIFYWEWSAQLSRSSFRFLCGCPFMGAMKELCFIIGALAIGVSRLQLQMDAFLILGYIGYALAGSVVGYGLFLLPQLLAFRMVKTNAVAGFMDSLWDFNNMPMGIYSRLIQRIGVFIIPIFVVTNFPAMFLLQKMSPLYAAWGIIAPLLLLVITRILFKKALRHYTSASS